MLKVLDLIEFQIWNEIVKNKQFSLVFYFFKKNSYQVLTIRLITNWI